jgi:hypothetical protein
LFDRGGARPESGRQSGQCRTAGANAIRVAGIEAAALNDCGLSEAKSVVLSDRIVVVSTPPSAR